MSAEHVLHLPTSWLLQLADALPERHHVIFSRITSMIVLLVGSLASQHLKGHVGH